MGRAKRLKIEALERERLAALARGEDVPSIFVTKKSPRFPDVFELMMQLMQRRRAIHCSKCGHNVPIYLANEHLARCSPEGVTCARCRLQIPGPDYVSHLMDCTGMAEVAEALGAEYSNKGKAE